MEKLTTRCCIAGGGPAGIMLGYLLARSGIDVVVLEKWPDFFRDFRGDTIHPSTMDILLQLGLLEKFLQLRHSESSQMNMYINGKKFTMADFRHLRTAKKFIAFIPQWDFLNFISEQARKYPSFHLMMQTEAEDLIYGQDGRVRGVRAKLAAGANGNESAKEIEIFADVVVGADGRHSIVREKVGLKAEELGVPIDVLWFRVSRLPSDDSTSLGRVSHNHFLVMIDRDDYWQCAYLIQKGGIEDLRAKGLPAFRAAVGDLAPFLGDRVEEIHSWDDIKLLNVTVDHLLNWSRPGLLMIGDAAHAMSPIGGVGINIAIHDSIAAANVLIPALKSGGEISERELAGVQQRREKPVRKMQQLQVFLQNNVVEPILRKQISSVPWPLRLFLALRLSWVPARIIGIGFQPERVSKEVLSGFSDANDGK